MPWSSPERSPFRRRRRRYGVRWPSRPGSGEDASIELHPDGEVRAGERTGFVEEVDEERRLVFWWAAPDEDSTRVELELEEDDGVTHVRVVESRPLAMLDLYGAEILTAAPPPPRQPEMLAR